MQVNGHSRRVTEHAVAFTTSSFLDAEHTTDGSSHQAPWQASSDAGSRCVRFRHSGWRATREKVLDAFNRKFAHASRVSRFRSCGSRAWVCFDAAEPSRFAVKSMNCGDRWCRACMSARSASYRSAIMTRLGTDPCRMVTLTLRARQQSLNSKLTDLVGYWRKLRKTRVWRQSVTGGIAVIEIKLQKHDRGWNVHMHCLTQGTWIDQRELSRTWHMITGDSYVVDVRLIRDAKHATHYVAKYLTKSVSHEVINSQSHLDEAIDALNGRKLVQPYGDWFGMPLQAPNDETDWRPLCSLHALLEACDRGDRHAQIVLASLRLSSMCHDPPLARLGEYEPW